MSRIISTLLQQILGKQPDYNNHNNSCVGNSVMPDPIYRLFATSPIRPCIRHLDYSPHTRENCECDPAILKGKFMLPSFFLVLLCVNEHQTKKLSDDSLIERRSNRTELQNKTTRTGVCRPTNLHACSRRLCAPSFYQDHTLM